MPTKITTNILFLITLLFAAMACTSNTTKIPPPPLNRTIFKTILLDMHTAETLAQTNQLKRKSQSSGSLSDFLAQVLCMHNVTANDFAQSLTYYSANNKDFDKIYEEMIMDLDKKEIEWQPIAQKEKQTNSNDITQNKNKPVPLPQSESPKKQANLNSKNVHWQIDKIKNTQPVEKTLKLTNKDK